MQNHVVILSVTELKLADDYDLKAPHYLILLFFLFLLVRWSLHSIPLSSSQRPKSKSKCFSMTLTITGCPGNAIVLPRKTEVAATMILMLLITLSTK